MYNFLKKRLPGQLYYLDCIAAIKALLKAKADVNLANGGQTNPVHILSSLGDLSLLRAIDKVGANYRKSDEVGPALHHAARAGALPAVQFILKKAGSIDVTNEDGWTALHMAAETGHAKVVEFLINKKANPELGTTGGAVPEGSRALEIAQRAGKKDVATFLRTVTTQSGKPT
jgi:ankyrin repeat protein